MASKVRPKAKRSLYSKPKKKVLVATSDIKKLKDINELTKPIQDEERN